MSSKKEVISKSYKQFVRKIVSEAKPLMLLQIYGVDIFYDMEDKGSAAEIKVNNKYYTAAIFCHKNLYDHYKGGDKNRVIEMIVHELSHIITEPLYVFAVDAATNSSHKHLETIREQTTEQVCWLVVDDVKKALKVKKK